MTTSPTEPRSGAPRGAIPGKTIAGRIRAGLDPRELTRDEMKSVCLWLESKGMTRLHMAEYLRTDRRRIWEILRDVGQEIRESDYDPASALDWIARTADDVVSLTRRVALAAEAKGDHAVAANAAWRCMRAARSLFDALQSMGILPKAAERVEVDVRVTERVKVVFAVVVDAICSAVPDPALRRRITDEVGRRLGESPETEEFVRERPSPVPARRPEPDDEDLDAYLGITDDAEGPDQDPNPGLGPEGE